MLLSSGRALLSITRYHLRSAKSGGGGDNGDHTVITNPDGSVTVEGPTLPGSIIVITYPDGTKDEIEAGEDGHYEGTSPPGQPAGPTTVEITLNAIEIEGQGYEITDAQFFVMPESRNPEDSVPVQGDIRGIETSDSGQIVTSEVL